MDATCIWDSKTPPPWDFPKIQEQLDKLPVSRLFPELCEEAVGEVQ